MLRWINTTDELNASEVCKSSPSSADVVAALHRSTTDSTLVNNSPVNSPALTPCLSPVQAVQCLPPPTAALVEDIKHVGRAAAPPSSLPDLLESSARTKDSDKVTPTGSLSRKNIVRMFSSEIDVFDELFDGKPPSLSRQESNLSTSQFDEYFDCDNMESCSMFLPNVPVEEPDKLESGTPEPQTPTNSRNMLFKVLKQTGFHQNALQQQQTQQQQQTPSYQDGSEQAAIFGAGKEALARANSTSLTSLVLSPTSEDTFRPRNMSVGKQSSRCSTPQTLMCG